MKAPIISEAISAYSNPRPNSMYNCAISIRNPKTDEINEQVNIRMIPTAFHLCFLCQSRRRIKVRPPNIIA